MGERLLIVDDDEFIRSIIQKVLEQAGYAVEAAEDGLAAWEKIDGDPSRFDLMLLDKKMPGLDGIALLKRIKSDDHLKDMPVVMLTGDNQQQDIVEGLAEGAYYYLTKPSAEVVLNPDNPLEETASLIKLLAIRLSPQAGKSLVIRRRPESR